MRLSRGHPGLRRWLVGIAAMSIVLTACGGGSDDSDEAGGGGTEEVAGDWDSVVEAANEEGEVFVYTSQGGSDEVFQAFEEAYPEISVTFVREPTGDLLTRLDQEIEVEAQGADVAYHAQPGWFAERAETDNLADIVYGPAAEGWPEDAMAERYVNILTIPFEAIWNTDNGEPIENVDEFLDRAGDAPIGLLDPSTSIAAASQYQAWVDAYGDDFLERLSQLNTRVEGSTVPLSQAVGSGELTYGLVIPAGIVNPLLDAGAPVDHGAPEESVGYNYIAAPLANAPNPNAAQVFINWLMEESTQELILSDLSPGASPIGAAGSMDRESIEVYELEDWPQERHDEFVQNFNSLFQQ